ncbi:MAG: ATP-binding cassette domain-containing protein [Proteobacteria bacterium]|nr:ATP-binding cassette domain-containing protein [Pseudomonadota bacterium]
MFRFLSGQIISDQNSKNSPTILFQKQLAHPPITKNFAFVPQSAKDGLFGLPVYEELRCATGKIDARKIDELIEILELEDFLSRGSFELSDGERMRILIATALASQTNFIILDEWETHLDSYWKKKVCSLLAAHCRHEANGTIELSSDNQGRSISQTIDLRVSKQNSISGVSSKELSLIFATQTQNDTSFEIKCDGNLKNGSFQKSISPCVFRTGTISAIVGRNGSGKTTLLRTLSKPKKSFLKVRSIFKEKNVAIILADPSVQIKISSLGEILSGAGLYRQSIEIVLNKILRSNKDDSSGNLSYARRKLLGAVLAFTSPVSAIIIDEFDAGLDMGSRDTMLKLISYAAKELKRCVIISATSEQKLCGLNIYQTIKMTL